MRKGKDYIDEAARKAVAAYYSALNSSPVLDSPSNNTFRGSISPDRKTITDIITGQVYNLHFIGSPNTIEIAFRLSDTDAFVKAAKIKNLRMDADSGLGYIAAPDEKWAYIRTLGSTVKFYLPIPTNLASLLDDQASWNQLQVRLSSDGNAVLMGTVFENPNTLILPGVPDTTKDDYFHQFANYTTYKNIKLIAYTSTNIKELPMGDLIYPVPIDQGFNIVYADPTNDRVANSLDLNKYSDGFVPYPEPGAPGSGSIFYPLSHANSVFSQFNILQDYTWSALSGEQQYGTAFGPGFEDVDYDNQSAVAHQTYKLRATPNSSVFSSYQFVINNDRQGNYDADLVVSFVNGYVVGITQIDWTESFEDAFRAHRTSPSPGSNGDYGQQYIFDEILHSIYSYTYSPDFAVNLTFLQSLDMYISTNPITGTKDVTNSTWKKNLFARQFSSVADLGVFDIHHTNENYNALTEHYQEVPNLAFGACQFAFRTSFTTGPTSIIPFLVDDTITVTYYSGIKRTLKNYFNTFGQAPNGAIIGSWPGYFESFKNQDGTFSSIFTYMDLNWDNLFFPDGFEAFTVYAGRSTMVINKLMTKPQPPLYGIVTQKLGDGSDNNALASAFRGRSFENNNNTGYIYKQDFSKIYFYSSPWLKQGNLSEIKDTGSANLPLSVSSDAFNNAISTLVDFQSLAGIYDRPDIVGEIQGLMDSYRNQQIPPPASLTTLYSNLRDMDGSLNSLVASLAAQLAAINGALTSGDLTVIGPDVIGFNPPDVYSDQIFSLRGTFPFGTSSDARTMKAVDSYIVQEYYTTKFKDKDGKVIGESETIQAYNIADGTTLDAKGAIIPRGTTTKGRNATRGRKTKDKLYDFVMPVSKDKTTS